MKDNFYQKKRNQHIKFSFHQFYFSHKYVSVSFFHYGTLHKTGFYFFHLYNLHKYFFLWNLIPSEIFLHSLRKCKLTVKRQKKRSILFSGLSSRFNSRYYLNSEYHSGSETHVLFEKVASGKIGNQFFDRKKFIFRNLFLKRINLFSIAFFVRT